MRYVWLALLPLLACAKTALWDDPGWSNPVEVIIETSSDGQSWIVAGCQPDGQTLSLTVPDANYYRARAIERGSAATGDCDVDNAERVSEYSNVFADIAELLPYSSVTVAPVLPWAIPDDPEPPVMASVVGTPVAITLGTSATPGAQAITVPAGAQAALVFWTYWYNGTGYGLDSVSATFASSWSYARLDGTTVATSVGVAYAPVTSTGAKTITPVFSSTPSEGPTFIVVFINGIDTGDWIRDVALDADSDTNAVSATVDSATDDLVLAVDQRYGGAPTLDSGWTSLLTANNNGEYALLRSADSPGDGTTTIDVADEYYSTLALVSIKTAEGGSTDDLTGDDLVAGTPTLDTPALGQTHVLSGSDLSASAPVLDTPALGQVHTLSATDLAAGTPVLDTPALSETSALTGDDLTAGTPALDSPAIGQVHALSGADLASDAPTLDTPALGQTHALSGTDLSASAPVLDSPALGQTHGLSATDLTAGTPTLDTPVLAEGSHALTGNDLVAGTPALDTPAIGQVHTLSATDLVSGTPVLDSPSIGQIHALTGSDLTAGTPTLDTPVLAEGNHVLIGDDLTAGTPALDTPAFGQIHALTGSDLTAGNPLLDSPVFGQIHTLSTTDLASGTPVLDTPALSEATALTGSNLTAGTPVLDSPTIAQIHVLIPDDLLTGAPTLTSADLGQIHGLLGNDLVAGTPVLDSPTLGEAGGFLIYTATVGTSTGAGASASGSSGWAAN